MKRKARAWVLVAVSSTRLTQRDAAALADAFFVLSCMRVFFGRPAQTLARSLGGLVVQFGVVF